MDRPLQVGRLTCSVGIFGEARACFVEVVYSEPELLFRARAPFKSLFDSSGRLPPWRFPGFVQEVGRFRFGALFTFTILGSAGVTCASAVPFFPPPSLTRLVFSFGRGKARNKIFP